MSIGNQELGIPRKYQYQIGIWYLCPKFFVFSCYFIGILSTDFLKFGSILVFFGRIKICLVFGFYGCHSINIGLFSVCHFPENGISTRQQYDSDPARPRYVRLVGLPVGRSSNLYRRFSTAQD